MLAGGGRGRRESAVTAVPITTVTQNFSIMRTFKSSSQQHMSRLQSQSDFSCNVTRNLGTLLFPNTIIFGCCYIKSDRQTTFINECSFSMQFIWKHEVAVVSYR